MAPKKDLVRYREVRVADLQNDQKTAAQIQNAPAASITQEQFQEFVLSQLKRIIHGDNPGTWRDDFEAQGILSLEDIIGGAGSLFGSFTATCANTDVIGAAVRVTAPGVVTTVDISVVGGFPAVGVIESKASPTDCVVRVLGPCSAFSGLTPGVTYLVGYAGQPAAGPLPPSITGRAAIQVIGVALSATTIYVNVGGVRSVRAN